MMKEAGGVCVGWTRHRAAFSRWSCVARKSMWWVARDQDPVGPVTTELLLEGIAAGKVGSDVLFCRVGGTEWKPITETAVFAEAIAQRRDAPVGAAFDDQTEHTLVDRR